MNFPTKPGIIQILFSQMRYIRLFFCCFLIFSSSVRAEEPEAQKQRPKATASLEIGADSLERRYIRPRLRFDFPVSFGLFYLDSDYYQRMNGQLQGEVDFWIDLGFYKTLSRQWQLTIDLNHFCRHTTSFDYPHVLDANELLAEFWFDLSLFRLGLGGGTFLGGNAGYKSLVILNIDWHRILDSEFSFMAETKLVDFKEAFYEFELSIALDPSVDILARYTKHYAYPKTTYLGLRFNSYGKTGEFIDKVMFRGGVFPGDETQKIFAENEFKLSFFRSLDKQVLLTLNGNIPIKRKDSFFGTFHPEEIKYLTTLEYEKKIGSELYGVVCGRYAVHMPVDVAQHFYSSLGVGIGLKNQSHFKKLEKPVRFSVYAGHNFSHKYDTALRLGVNTVAKAMNLGVDIQAELNPNRFTNLVEAFVEFGKEVKFRPYIAFEWTEFLDSDQTGTRLLFGIDLTTWK